MAIEKRPLGQAKHPAQPAQNFLVAVDSGTDFFTCSFKLKNFKKFDSAATAVEEAASIIEGKVTPLLTEVLKDLKDEKKASLAVADVKLGTYY